MIPITILELYLIEADPLPFLRERGLGHLGLVSHLAMDHPQQPRSQS